MTRNGFCVSWNWTCWYNRTPSVATHELSHNVEISQQLFLVPDPAVHVIDQVVSHWSVTAPVVGGWVVGFSLLLPGNARERSSNDFG